MRAFNGACPPCFLWVFVGFFVFSTISLIILQSKKDKIVSTKERTDKFFITENYLLSGILLNIGVEFFTVSQKRRAKPKNMEIKFKNVRDKLYIYLYGELDEHTSGAIRGLIDDLIDMNISADAVVFNMSNVSFMDSTGLGFLLGRYKKLRNYGVKCYIEAPKCSVEKVMLLSGIYDVMPRI